MNWKKRFRLNNQMAPTAPPIVASLDGIPDDARSDESFRISVEIINIAERITRTNDPCYFIHVKDDDGVSFSIVAWESQWSKLHGTVSEGARMTFDVRVPAEGHSAFTLAS